MSRINRDREEQKQRDRAAKQESSRALESLANVTMLSVCDVFTDCSPRNHVLMVFAKVRVIQRNLVYVTGLPLKHAYDEVSQ